MTTQPSLMSQDDPDEDPELLLIVPFSEAVTMKSISILSHHGNPNNRTTIVTAAPRTVRIYVDRTNLDFETVRDLEPTTTITLMPPSHQWSDEHTGGTIDYPLRPAGRFQNITEIALYFCDNYDMPMGFPTEITYVGFKGKGLNVKRKAVKAVYETRGMKKDHKVHGSEYFGREGV